LKIILISLPAPFLFEPAVNPPLGIGYICSYLNSKGFNNVEILDFALFKDYDFINSNDYLKEIPLDADFYGISATSSVYHWLYEISNFLKENTNGKIVAGGAHPTSMPKQTMMDTSVDFVICGDGEEPMYQLISGVKFEKIPGLCYRFDSDFVVKTRNYCKELDALPFPARYNLDKYSRNIDGDKALHLITLRGCPYNCAFCDKKSVGAGVRYRSVENVIAEIDEIIEQHGIKGFVICDEIFPLIKERTKEFCDEFKKRGLKWRCWCRADLVNEKVLTMMKDSGLVSIQIGIESGDNDVLKAIHKGSNYEINKKALLACKKIGIPTRCNLMYGNPKESLESVKNTIRLVEETQPDEWTLAILTPVPGSAIWEKPNKYGIDFDRQWAIDNHFMMTNRFSESGIGDVWISINGTTEKEFKDNLEYFVSELNKVCPKKKKVQDTAQIIDVNKVKVLKKNG